MRKIISTAIFLTLIALLIYFVLHPEISGFVTKEKKENLKIDPKIEKLLKKEHNVTAIILLKEINDSTVNEVVSEQKKIRQKVKISQENFEKTTSTKIKYKFGSMSAVISEIVADDIEELKNNPLVDKVIIPEKPKIFLDKSRVFIKADLANNMSVEGNEINGSGQTICVIDTGVDYTHPDLGGCTNESFLSGTCEKVIGGYDYFSNDADPLDEYGHGTLVAGVVAANGQLKGIAPGAKLVALKVCNDLGVCDGEAILKAIDWCVSNATKYNITVIQMSVGWGNSEPGYCDNIGMGVVAKPLIDAGVANGLSIVAAAGNEKQTNAIAVPACLKNVTSVGSSYHFNDSSLVHYTSCEDNNVKIDTVPCYSNSADILDLTAPGSFINSTFSSLYGLYNVKSGTSLAAPHVSGSIALLRQYLKLKEKNFTPEEIEMLLKHSGEWSTDLRNNLSFPRVNAYDLLQHIFIINNSEKSIENAHGKIVLNTTESLENASFIFKLKYNLVSLDSTKYPQLNVSANITLYNLKFLKTPLILRDNIPCSDCIIISYEGGNLTFLVTHFTNYSTIANSKLVIFDENDQEGGYLNKSNIEDTLFFANYTNATDGAPITSAECNITFSDNISAIYTMIYNSSYGMFIYPKKFPNPGDYYYNISCADINFEPINLSDDILSLPGCGLPPPNINWVIPENSSVECNDTILYFQNQTLITMANSNFVSRNATFFLRSSPKTEEVIIINETGRFSMYNSTFFSNSSTIFILRILGEGDIYDSTFGNNSQLDIKGNKQHYILNSTFYYFPFFEENSYNLINKSLFYSEVYTYNYSINHFYDSQFLGTFYSYGQSYSQVTNSTFNYSTISVYLRENSVVNFTLPRSIIIGPFRASDNATLYGYVDMPTSAVIPVPNSAFNRFYPVWVNYTNGSVAAGVRVNITNGSVVVWSGITDSEGIAYPNLTFKVGTYAYTTPYFNISVNPVKDIGLLTDTPIIFEIDNVAPGLNVTSPINNSYYNNTVINLNYSVWDDKDIDSCWYINVSGGIEIIPSCSNITFEAVEGLNNITIYVNDSSNNINYTQIFFYVDITSPVVNLENPQNNSLITNTNNITFYYNVSDNIGIENASLIINDILNQTNYSIIINTTQNFIVLNMPNGQYNWSVIAYDLAGNWNISYVYNLTIRFFWCGDGICNNGETCNSCRADCGVCTPAGGGGGGGGGGSSGGGALIIPKEGTGEENIKPEKEEVIEARKRNIGYSTKSAVAESPAVFEKEKNIIPNLDFVIGGIIFGLTIILISSLLWHFPLIYFYRRTFADEEVIIKFIEKDRLRYHRKIFVTPNVYERYKLKLEEQKKKCNLAPIYLYKKDEKFVNHLIYRYHINTELAKLICAAKRGVISRILTTEKISDELRKRFRKIKFEDPFEYEKKFGS